MSESTKEQTDSMEDHPTADGKNNPGAILATSRNTSPLGTRPNSPLSNAVSESYAVAPEPMSDTTEPYVPTATGRLAEEDVTDNTHPDHVRSVMHRLAWLYSPKSVDKTDVQSAPDSTDPDHVRKVMQRVAELNNPEVRAQLPVPSTISEQSGKSQFPKSWYHQTKEKLESSIAEAQSAALAPSSLGANSPTSDQKTQTRVRSQSKKGVEPARIVRFSKEQTEKIFAVGIPRANGLGIYYTDTESGELRFVIRGTKTSNSAGQIRTQGLSDEQVAEMATTMATASATPDIEPVPEPDAPEYGVVSQRSGHTLNELPSPPAVTQEARVAMTGGPHQDTTASPSPDSGSLDAEAEEESEKEYQWWTEVDYKMGMDTIDKFDWGTST